MYMYIPNIFKVVAIFNIITKIIAGFTILSLCYLQRRIVLASLPLTDHVPLIL